MLCNLNYEIIFNIISYYLFLQVDFASRECQTSFFDKLEMTGQLIPGDGTRPWERRERRGPEFEVVRNDDRYGRCVAKHMY